MTRILVADDNPLTLRFLVGALSGPGIECSEAEDGERAVTLARSLHHDLLVLDARMPGCSGADALARIRMQEGPSRDATAIATTADDSAHAHADLLARGFVQVLAKPMTASELRVVAWRHLRGSVAEDPPAWIDEAQALRATGGDRGSAAALRSLLVRELEDLPEELRQYASRSDAEALRDRLHRLDASAGICGVPSLRDAVARVRHGLGATPWPVAELEDLAGLARRLCVALQP